MNVVSGTFSDTTSQSKKKQNNSAIDPICAYAYITLDVRIKNAV